MRIGLFVAYWPWFSPEEQVALARQADAGLDSVWVTEAWGQDAVSVLGHLSAVTENVALGSGLMQIPGRTPAMTAMTAATLDVLSGGRFRPGLGVSGPAGVGGLARRAVLTPAGPHARIRGDRPGGARARGAARVRGRGVPPAGERHGPRQAAEAARAAGAGAHPDLPRRDGPERHRADHSAVCCRPRELDERLAEYARAGATTLLAMPFGDRPAIVDQLVSVVAAA